MIMARCARAPSTPGILINLPPCSGAEDASWAAAAYGVTAAGTFEEGSSTLQLKADQDHQRLTGVRARLLAAREQRARPARDDKVVAAWNGWLIDSLVQSAMIFDRPDWLAMAIEAAEAIWALHWQHGRLRRASRDGVVGTAPGILEDYGAFAQACVRTRGGAGGAGLAGPGT